MYNLNNLSCCLFKIQFVVILLFTCLRINGQSITTWDRDTIQDSLLSLKIDSLVIKDFWHVDPYETEKDFVKSKFSKWLFKDFYMQDIHFNFSEIIKNIKGQEVYSYSGISIIVAPKSRRLLLRTILFCSGVKFNSFKGKRNCLIITREPNEKGKSTNFNVESIILAKYLLSHLKK